MAVLYAKARVRPAALGRIPSDRLVLQPLSAFPESAADDEPTQRIANWMRAYLMRPHPALGRDGPVCPYTQTSARADLAFVGTSGAQREEEVHSVMREAVAVFDAMDCPPAMRAFRCILVGFPACAGEEGRATLKRVQNRLRPESTRRAKMIGLFDPDAGDRGLINSEFRPLRSTLPLLAIRSLVEADAPFVLRNPRLAAIYLWTFPRTGPRRLLRCLWR